MNNSYDGQAVIWEIECMNSGNDPERYDWTGWISSPARDEVKADRVRVDFLETPDAAKPWNRTHNHFKLSPARTDMGTASDGGSRGVDLSLIPDPPQERGPE